MSDKNVGGPSAGPRSGRAGDASRTAAGIASAVRAGELSAVEAVTAALARTAEVEPELHAFHEVWGEAALERAAEVDRLVAAGTELPLAGVPIGVKGVRGARSAAARALVAAGCVPLGATSVPGPGTPWQTWGLGRGGRTRNPWRADRTPGGSSAGSAAAVAAGLVPLATGSDGAGSVRIPAAWCGVFGLKVTNGLLPSPDRTGLAAPGVLARSAADMAAFWRAVCGAGYRVGAERHPGPDAAPGLHATPGSHGLSGPNPPPGPGGAALPLAAVWSDDLGFARPDREPAAIARRAAGRLAEAGVVRFVTDEPVRLADPGAAWQALRTPGADLAAAERVRAENDRRLAAIFARVPLLLTPATPNPPHGHEGPGERYSTALTWAFNLSGHPAASIPAGFGADGCPVGLQVVAPHGAEPLLLAVAEAAERAAGLCARSLTPVR
ncbi:amidase family protein [Streptomyces sp. NPDC053560]|uniref:amidase family protein n=1 Tax=Streptomyces sp. NPDC053560 TaxID=3365711 RepID=UPI0037CFA0E4